VENGKKLTKSLVGIKGKVLLSAFACALSVGGAAGMEKRPGGPYLKWVGRNGQNLELGGLTEFSSYYHDPEDIVTSDKINEVVSAIYEKTSFSDDEIIGLLQELHTGINKINLEVGEFALPLGRALQHVLPSYEGEIDLDTLFWLLENPQFWADQLPCWDGQNVNGDKVCKTIFAFAMENPAIMEGRNRPLLEWLFEREMSERLPTCSEKYFHMVNVKYLFKLPQFFAALLKIENASDYIFNIKNLLNAEKVDLEILAANPEILAKTIRGELDDGDDGQNRLPTLTGYFQANARLFAKITELEQTAQDSQRETTRLRQDFEEQILSLEVSARILQNDHLGNGGRRVEQTPGIEKLEDNMRKLKRNMEAVLRQVAEKNKELERMRTLMKQQVEDGQGLQAQLKCPYCKDELILFDEGTNVAMPIIKTNCCGQKFHEDCLKQWIRTKNTCPACRNENPIG